MALALAVPSGAAGWQSEWSAVKTIGVGAGVMFGVGALAGFKSDGINGFEAGRAAFGGVVGGVFVTASLATWTALGGKYIVGSSKQVKKPALFWGAVGGLAAVGAASLTRGDDWLDAEDVTLTYMGVGLGAGLVLGLAADRLFPKTGRRSLQTSRPVQWAFLLTSAGFVGGVSCGLLRAASDDEVAPICRFPLFEVGF